MTTKITDKNISSLANAGVSWQSVVVADGSTGLTAVAGRGYFINTTSGIITVTLPTSPNVGDVVVLKDYARTWGTNNVNIASNTFDGVTNNPSFSTSGQTVTLVFMDNTKGFSLINEDTTTGLGAEFISATGGTVTTSGDFKIHSFTGDGCFVVATVGNPAGSEGVDYLVVAGGGSGGSRYGGGGGGGGFRTSFPSPTSCSTGPFPVSATTYPITVGGGGAGVPCVGGNEPGNRGSSSIFSTITSTGGGGGQGQAPGTSPNIPGGSGGGGSYSPGVFGTGNTPPVAPPQGNPGGTGNPGGAISPYSSGGGGGAGTAAIAAPGPASGTGGVGSPIATTFFGPTAPSYGTPGPAPGRYFAGGGGGGATCQGATTGPGGAGGGTDGGSSPGVTTTAGTVNTGGASGGGYGGGTSGSGAGGKGIVVIRYKFQ